MPFIVSYRSQFETNYSMFLSVDIGCTVLIHKYLAVVHDCHRFSLLHDNLAGLSLTNGRRVQEIQLLLQVQPQLPFLL